MSYQIQAKGTLDFPDVDPKDSTALGSYFHKDGEDKYADFYKQLGGRPNSRFFAARMTLLNALSDHKNGPRIVIDVAGANLQSLIAKPVHFVDDFETHWTQKTADKGQREIKTFGVTLGGRLHAMEDDGSYPLDVFGMLWDEDHPEAVKMVASSLDEMGMSWEIAAAEDSMRQVKHPDVKEPILFIGQCEFTGTAILKRGSAAYPSSHLLVAGAKGSDLDLDFSRIPVLDDKHVTIHKASSASPPSTGPKDGPNLSITIVGGATENATMGKF